VSIFRTCEFAPQEVSLIPSKESCIGQVTIKQFVFVIGFEVLTSMSKKSEVFWAVTPFIFLCYDPRNHTLQFVFIVCAGLLKQW
jgi:hypothetical protein